MYAILLASTLILTNNIDTTQNEAFWIEKLQASSLDLKINAIQKLAEIRESQSFRAIARVLSDQNSEVRYYAIRALSKFPTQESLNLLQTHLSSEPDPYLKSESKRSIRSIQEILNKNLPKEEKPAEDEEVE